MVDLQETPAVPPFDGKGDERAGLFAAGGILITVGWGFGVVLNLLLHWLAPASGVRHFGVYFGPALGPYAWASLGFGAFAGAMGTAFLWLGRQSPKGPVVLPGYEY